MTPCQPPPTDHAQASGLEPGTPDGPGHAPTRAQTLPSPVQGAGDAVSCTSSTETLGASFGPPLSMRELRRLLRESPSLDSEPSSPYSPRAPVHKPLLSQVTSSVSSSCTPFNGHVVTTRHSVQVVAVQAPASHDEWLADARSRQQHPRRQRERCTQKMQSDTY